MEIFTDYTHPILVLQFCFFCKCFHFPRGVVSCVAPPPRCSMPAMQMFDTVNIQKLIVFSGLAEHKPTHVCRNSIFQKQQWVCTDMCSALLRALAKALWMCPEKRNVPGQSSHSNLYHQELVEKIPFLSNDLLFMQYVLFHWCKHLSVPQNIIWTFG